MDSSWVQRLQEMDNVIARFLRNPEKDVPTGIVYFVRAGETDLVKVGYSADLSTRMRTLQTANGEELTLEHVHESNDVRTDELGFHRELGAQHIRGEWFRLPCGFDFGALARRAL